MKLTLNIACGLVFVFPLASVAVARVPQPGENQAASADEKLAVAPNPSNAKPAEVESKLAATAEHSAEDGKKPAAAKSDSAKPQPEPVKVSEEQAKKAEKLFEDGRTAFFQTDYKTAKAKLTDAVAADPSKAGHKLMLAKALRYLGEADQAAALLGEVFQANPEHVEAGLEWAELLSPEKQPDKVIEILEPLLKFKHDYPVYHLLAEAQYQKENLDKAREYYEIAVKLNPRSAGDFYQVGNIYLAQKHFAKAANAYETANRLGLSSGVMHFKLASVYFNLHNYLGNVTTAEVLGGQPGDIKNELYLIDPVPGKKDQFYVAQPRSAIFQTAKAQQMRIDIFEIRFLEANIWLSARRFAKAEKIYADLKDKVKKDDAGLFWFYFSQTALGLDHYDDYLKRLNNAIEAQPDVYKPMLADAYSTVADRHHARGEMDSYLDYLTKAVNTTPLSARLHLMLGDAHWQASHRDKAVEQYKLLLEIEPDHADRVRLLNRIRGQEESPAPSSTAG